MPPHPDAFVYTDAFLAALSDSELAAHLFDTIGECGEDDDATKRLQAEVTRRGLTDRQVSEAYFRPSKDRAAG